jgi:hypothetical protein
MLPSSIWAGLRMVGTVRQRPGDEVGSVVDVQLAQDVLDMAFRGRCERASFAAISLVSSP